MSSKPTAKSGTKRAKAATATGRPLGRKALLAQKKNEQMVAHAIAEAGLVKFAKVVKMLGCDKVEVINEKGKTGIAMIRGVLTGGGKRGCMFEVNDIVVIERIDGTTTAYDRRYLIVAKLPRKEAQKLHAEGILPDHLYHSDEILTKQTESLAEADEDGFYFDYIGDDTTADDATAASGGAGGPKINRSRALPKSEYFTEDGEIDIDRI